MSDLADDFRAMKQWRREQKTERLAEFDRVGWTMHSEHHFSRAVDGIRLDYWPSTGRYRWANIVAGTTECVENLIDSLPHYFGPARATGEGEG